MRFLGVDFGQRRIGLALSDATGLLARPWRGVAAGATPQASAAIVAEIVNGTRDGRDPAVEPIEAIVVGLPRRLNGQDNDQTAPARAFAGALAELTSLAVELQDERLTSHEADRHLAAREPDWRRRKTQIDAIAAAIILQDHLDARARQAAGVRAAGPC